MKLLILHLLFSLIDFVLSSKPVQINSVDIKTIVAGHVDDHSRKVHASWRDIALIFFIAFYGLLFIGCGIVCFIVMKRRRSRAQPSSSLSATNTLLQLLIGQIYGSNLVDGRRVGESHQQQQEAASVSALLQVLIEELRNRDPAAFGMRSGERPQQQQRTPSSELHLEMPTTFSQLRGHA